MQTLTEEDTRIVVEREMKIKRWLEKSRAWLEQENLPDALRYLNEAQNELAWLDLFLKQRERE